MAEPTTCAACGAALQGRKVLWEYRGETLWLCGKCASLPLAERFRAAKDSVREIDQRARQREQPTVRYRQDLREDQIEPLLLHAFLDLVEERKAAGRQELVATQETIAAWLSDRTTLPVKAQHVQYLTQALREGLIITVGGGGIGRPNSYDTTEAQMGVDAFWDQVDAFLMAWRMPNRLSLLVVDDGKSTVGRQ